MCTVSYIPTSVGFILTSTRDEVVYREATPPAFYQVGTNNLIFPKDQKSNGTWICSDGGTLSVCLLNGAWTNHQKQENYKMSRGLIPLEVFEYADFKSFAENFDFSLIEPFTLIGVQESYAETQLLELRWNGSSSSLRELNSTIPHLWSSVTLYPPSVQEKRNALFEEFQLEDDFVSQKRIQQFHLQKNFQDAENSFLLDSATGPKSISLTQLVRVRSSMTVHYLDLLTNAKTYIAKEIKTCHPKLELQSL